MANIEVLAPVGSFKMVNEVLSSGCDAIYLGGIEFNMRMHSKLLNFTNDEIGKTVQLAHKINKKVYVTVNTWFENKETDLMLEYLLILEKTKVDAIIVQDLGVINLIRKHNINLDIHASVMMNVHNEDQIKVLSSLGITRFVVSREMSLFDVKLLQEKTNAEIEYFVSGDMCTVNGGVCYYSGILFSKSANRGQCFKMCRWNYDLKYGGQKYDGNYYLAAKDIDLSQHIDKIAEAHVASLKIEGRRKPVDNIVPIVEIYRNAVDEYYNNIYNPKKYEKLVIDNYSRDVSTAYAFGKPGINFVNKKNEGNPNAGRIFSTRGKEISSTKHKIEKIKSLFNNVETKENEISIKIDSYEAANLALKYGPNYLYISIEALQKNVMTVSEIQKIIDIKENTKIYLSLPMMQSNLSKQIETNYISTLNNLDGLVVSDIGQLVKYSETYDIHLDYTFNVMNSEAATLLKYSGANKIMPSIEANSSQLFSILENNNFQKNLLAFGNFTTMYLDLDLYENIQHLNPICEEDNELVDNNVLVLKNKLGQENPVYKDCFEKNHLTTSKPLNLLPIIDELNNFENINFIIEGRTLSLDELEKVIISFKEKLKLGNKFTNEICEANERYTLGALTHLEQGAKYVIIK